MRKSKRQNAEAQKDVTAWMVTFGDLLMLLLTFFVMLLTMSSMDLRSLKRVFSIFRGAVGPLELSDVKRVKSEVQFVERGSGGAMELPDLEKIKVWKEHYRKIVQERGNIFNELYNVLTEILSMDGGANLSSLKEIFKISQDERGVVITLQEAIMFDPGKAELKPTVFPILEFVAEVIDPLPNDVLIMGHSDNMAFDRGRYRSNWHLSMYRALNVHAYFVGDRQLSEDRFGVGSYGDLRPVFSNTTAGGRQENRRVEIVIQKI